MLPLRGTTRSSRASGEVEFRSPGRPGVDLIVLNYHFPPDPSMGGMRWAGLSKYMARAGARIHVVACGPKDAVEHLPAGVVVHRVARRRTLNDVYRGYREAAISGRSPELAAGTSVPERGGAPPRGGFFAGLRQELSWLMAFPDDSRGWILRALRATVPSPRTRPLTRRRAFADCATAVLSWLSRTTAADGSSGRSGPVAHQQRAPSGGDRLERAAPRGTPDRDGGGILASATPRGGPA